MVTAVRPFQGATSVVGIGGKAVIAAFGPMLGGFIKNSINPLDQGLTEAEPIYVDLTTTAIVGISATCSAVYPGQTFTIPEGFTGNVSVNASSSGHMFSIYVVRSPIPAPTPSGSVFPPATPTGLLDIIPSYLYQEYSDDDNLQAFVASYNTMAQSYLDWFNYVGLPIYTGETGEGNPSVSGTLLDWVGTGLYGYLRPNLASGVNLVEGPYNTFDFNVLPYNGGKTVGPSDAQIASDDVYRRCLTWHFYKGDGKYFTVPWLKRRIMRFLLGTDGTTPNIDNTYPVSVTFGANSNVTITFINGYRTVTGGAIYNEFEFNEFPLNFIESEFTSVTPPVFAPIFEEAVNSGILELPFQYTWTVRIGA